MWKNSRSLLWVDKFHRLTRYRQSLLLLRLDILLGSKLLSYVERVWGYLEQTMHFEIGSVISYYIRSQIRNAANAVVQRSLSSYWLLSYRPYSSPFKLRRMLRHFQRH